MTTMNFPTALQQILHKEYPEPHAPNMGYPARAPSPHQNAYSSGCSNFGDPTQFNASTQTIHQQHYSTQQLQYHQQQHLHYNNTYNSRLISDGTNNNVSSGPVSSTYSNRARYLPYPHSLPQHSTRGMYTPAGQQVIPSSVLHYPPRSAAYQPNIMTLQQHTQPQLQSHLRQQQQPSLQAQMLHHQTSLGGNESQMRHYAYTLNKTQPAYGQETRQMPHLLMHLNGNRSPPATSISPPTTAPAQTSRNVSRPPSADYNTYLQLKHQYQQSLSSPTHAHMLSNEELLTTNMPKSQQTALPSQRLTALKIQTASSTSSELPTMSEDAQDSSRDCHEEKHRQTSTSHSVNNNNGASTLISLASSSRIDSPRQTAKSECLTTSPPLISATGTDSGISISSCSTRARSDSTQSTPVYNGEYPMSVGSSSGVSYQCADIKDYEEFGRENEENVTCAPLKKIESLKCKQETCESDINMGHSIPGGLDEKNSNTRELAIDRELFKDRIVFETTEQCGE